MVSDYMSFEKAIQAKRSIGYFLLDPKNPRLPPTETPLTQDELIHELAIHDDVYSIASSIATHGFFLNDPLIAIKDGTKLLVVEGNRRLAACKLLIAPEAAPEKLRNKFTALAASFNPTRLKQIPVVIAVSRDSVSAALAARHTAPQIAPWKPAMKANFYFTMVQGGMTIEQVSIALQVPAGEIKNALVAHNLYAMACRLSLPDDTAQKVRDPREFNLTTLQRIFESSAGKKFFGTSVDADGTIAGKIKADEFEKPFKKVVADIANDEANSRSLHSAEHIKKYLETLPVASQPDHSKAGSFTSTTFLAGGAPHQSNKPKPKKKQSNVATKPFGLIPSGIPCNIQNNRVQSLFGELRHLSPADGRFPNACAFTLRSFLELSLFCFLKGKGEISKMETEERATIAAKNARRPANNAIRLPANWTPELELMLSWVLKHPNILNDNQLQRALQRIITNEEDLVTLNLYTHSPVYPATEARVRESWGKWEEFFKIILA